MAKKAFPKTSVHDMHKKHSAHNPMAQGQHPKHMPKNVKISWGGK